METTNNLISTKMKVKKQLGYIPDFIDTHKVEDYQLWQLICAGNSILLELMVDICLSSKVISIAHSGFTEIIETVMATPVLSDKKLEVAAYFLVIMEYIKGECSDNELWESMANFKKFEDMSDE